jgi:hypothetical protein
MAHSCPECGQVCYCGGDIDDCCFSGTVEESRCMHCPIDGYDDDPDDDYPPDECDVCHDDDDPDDDYPPDECDVCHEVSHELRYTSDEILLCPRCFDSVPRTPAVRTGEAS